MHSLLRAAARPARNVLLAGLVGFTVLGSTGVAFAAPAKRPPVEHAYKPAKAAKKKAAEASNPDVPSIDRHDFGCVVPEAPNSGPGVGQATVTVQDLHEPPQEQARAAADETTFTYKVSLLRNTDGDNYPELKSAETTVALGQTSDPVVFKDLPGGLYKVEAQLIKDGKPIDGQSTTGVDHLDRCAEIHGPITGPLQVFQQCDKAMGGLVSMRVFAQTEDPKVYTLSVSGGGGTEPDHTSGDLSTRDGDENYAILYDAIPFADGTYTARAFVKDDPSIDQTTTFTVACKGNHQPTDNPTTPTATVPPATNVAETKPLAKTGVSVLWPAVGGVAVLALGAGLFVFSRRRGANTSK